VAFRAPHKDIESKHSNVGAAALNVDVTRVGLMSLCGRGGVFTHADWQRTLDRLDRELLGAREFDRVGHC